MPSPMLATVVLLVGLVMAMLGGFTTAVTLTTAEVLQRPVLSHATALTL